LDKRKVNVRGVMGARFIERQFGQRAVKM
jgi:hypothetical protein